MAAHVETVTSLSIRVTGSNSQKGNGSIVAWLTHPDGSGSQLCITGSFLEGFLAVGTRQVNLPGFLVPQDQDLARWRCY